MTIELQPSYVGPPSVTEQPGQVNKIILPVDIQGLRRGEDDLRSYYIFNLMYEVELWEQPEYEANVPRTDGLRLELGEFSHEHIFTDFYGQENDNPVELEVPLVPETIEQMNRISAEGNYISFNISITDGIVFKTARRGGDNTSAEQLEDLGYSEVTQTVAGQTYSTIRFRREDFNDILAELEGAENQWLSISIPTHDTGTVSESVRDDLSSAVENLQRARSVVHTQNFGQAMIDLRNVRDNIAVKEERNGEEQWYLKEDFSDGLRMRRGNRERRVIRDMVQSLGHLASKYVHEDRPELEQTPPWEETQFVYAEYSYLIWYISKVLS